MKKLLTVVLLCCLFATTVLAGTVCPSCQAGDQVYAYCTLCGTKMPDSCPGCGWTIPTNGTFNYCGDCGMRLNRYDLNGCAVGDVVTFGSYEQDDNLANGSEPIKWVVLSVKSDRVLLLAVNALDAQPFDVQGREVDWLSSSLRVWMNEDFCNAAFNVQEQALLYQGKPFNNEYYDVNDRVFLLDYDGQVSPVYNFIGMGGLFIPENYKGTPLMDSGLENYEWAEPTAVALGRARSHADKYYWDCGARSKYVEDGCFYSNDSDSVLGVRPAIWVTLP